MSHKSSLRLSATATASGRPRRDYLATPRTPHSKSGRAEEGITEDDFQDDEDFSQFVSYRKQQSEPLLASSASASFPVSGYRSRGDDSRSALPPKSGKWRKKLALQNTPLFLGILLAGLLFSLIIVRLTNPDALDRFIGYTKDAAQKAVQGAWFPPTPTFVDTFPPPGHLISYENYTTFPLTGTQYRDECAKMMSGFMHHPAYWDPPMGGVSDVPHHDDVTDYHLPEGLPTKTCSKTITYQLDGHVGLAADLALMAQAAALARERNRTFFVDDTYWNRGKWTDHFQAVHHLQPGPEPGCHAPRQEELVACPRHARHWVINSRTARYHFGHGFYEQYEDPYQREVNRQKPIFEQALQSFKETIRPNTHNAALIRAMRREIAAELSLPIHKTPQGSNFGDAEALLTAHNPDPYIAVHIRKGDRHASSFPYRGKHVPLPHFVTAAIETWKRLYKQDVPLEGSDSPVHFPAPPVTYVASDSHVAAHDFISSFSSSTAMFSLESSTDAALRALAPQQEYVQHEFDALEESERIRLTRGMIVDLAMVSGLWAYEGEIVPGATICTLTSNVCRIAAMGLGWDRAFGLGDGKDHRDGTINEERRRWVELDNKGIVSPVWTAYETF